MAIVFSIGKITIITIDYYDYNLIFVKSIDRINYFYLYYIIFSHLIKFLSLINNIIIINYYFITFNFIC